MSERTHHLEIWASPEPTIARVRRTEWRDQLLETGHYQRDEDLDLLADLRISASRYPVLWEHTAPGDPATLDLRWARKRLLGLRQRGVEPVVTLLHHGSGPSYTELLDANFPSLFAAYAGQVARAFPWIRRWTPINEMTTTARFSTLYGTWHPNRIMDHRAFGRAMFHQGLGTLLAMQEIRRYAPQAELVITEDLQGFVSGDERAEQYCAHKRERSYLGIDLICGRVDERHGLWNYLTEECMLSADSLRRLREAAVSPALLGFNYYANSERFVQSRADGGFDNVPLVDVVARPLDPKALLRAAHQRYGTPFGLTEIHLCGDEADRVAWFLERVRDLTDLVDEGLPCIVAGAWAAFGMVDWRSLLTRRVGASEDGIYTCAGQGKQPRATLLTSTIQRVSAGVLPPVGNSAPWWRCEERRRAVGERTDAA